MSTPMRRMRSGCRARGRQHHKLDGVVEEECIRRNDERIGAHLHQWCKSRIDAVNSVGHSVVGPTIVEDVLTFAD
jgi:hypothetical protein